MDKTYCAACGAELDEDPALPPEQRPPCPACGARNLERSITDRVVLSDSGAALEAIGVTKTTGSATLAHAQTAEMTITAYDATVRVEEAPTHTPERVVDETGVVVRVVRHYPPTVDNRRVTTVEDEYGTIRDLGAGDTADDTLLDLIISGALRPDEGE